MRRLDPLRRKAASREQPRDHRVRVPHLARPKLVSAPDWAGQAANQVEQATRQQEARWFGREQPVEFDPSFAEFSSLMTEVRYFDLRDPRLDSPG